MTIGEERRCIDCGKEVEIVGEVKDVKDDDVVHQTLSCGHTPKLTHRRAEEGLSLRETVKSDVIKIEALGKEGAPMQVSGATGISQVVSISELNLTYNNNIGYIINNMNFSPQHIETTNTTITANNLQDIILQIEKSNLSEEDKENTKGILSKLATLGQTAAPYIQMAINMWLKGNPQ